MEGIVDRVCKNTSYNLSRHFQTCKNKKKARNLVIYVTK